MLIAIDCGNTNLVVGVLDGSILKAQFRVSTREVHTAAEITVLVKSWMKREEIDPAGVDGVVLATVVPRMRDELVIMSDYVFGCAPLTVGDVGTDLGIEVRMDRPEDVGADRLVNAVSAHATYGGPLIVLDFGTATTFDVVDSDGNYRGGVIAPGVSLSLEALHAAAAKLPKVPIKKPAHAIGTDTVSAMQSGIYWGYIGLIEGIVERIRAEMNGDPKLIATGGLAHFYADSTDVISQVDSDLTLRGLAEVWNRNQT